MPMVRAKAIATGHLSACIGQAVAKALGWKPGVRSCMGLRTSDKPLPGSPSI